MLNLSFMNLIKLKTLLRYEPHFKLLTGPKNNHNHTINNHIFFFKFNAIQSLMLVKQFKSELIPEPLSF